MKHMVVVGLAVVVVVVVVGGGGGVLVKGGLEIKIDKDRKSTWELQKWEREERK